MDVAIRSVEEADVADLMELAVRAWGPVFVSFARVLGPTIYALLYPDWQKRQREAVARVCGERGRYDVWVAEAGGAVVGFIAIEVDGAAQTGEVDLLAVHPDAQNRGVGTALNRFALERMRERGVKLAVVATGGDPGHAPARRCYEKSGYTALPLVRYYQALQEEQGD